jgi:hypothetical protein
VTVHRQRVRRGVVPELLLDVLEGLAPFDEEASERVPQSVRLPVAEPRSPIGVSSICLAHLPPRPVLVGQTEAPMDRRAFIGLGLALAVAMGSSGCTTPPDWIERTLVTVDVTGHWYGSSPQSSGTSSYPEFWLDLQQQAGPKARGSIRAKGIRTGAGIAGTGWVPIEGTIAGDVFSFRQTDGPAWGELKVRGDEMTGEVSIGFSGPIIVRRIESSPRPDSQRQ